MRVFFDFHISSRKVPGQYNKLSHNCFLQQTYQFNIQRLQNDLNIASFTSTTNKVSGGIVVKALRYKPAGRGFDF